ncbi:MAG TPA: FKBP-type peptidyl-prolyl cis-trans isomerase, partial [Flavobacteriales bacterium]|nr:FKBP-type peptidyl-prolyl cis-trans isomerase [Flavobacteriales bacterium]
MRSALFLFACAVVFAACSSGPLPGAKRIAEDVHWKLRVLGEGERLPADSDSLLMRVRMAYWGAEPGSLFSTERWYGPHAADLFFRRMRVGDSASVALTASKVPWAALGATPPTLDTGWVAMELSLRDLRSAEEWRAMQRAQLAARTPAEQEQMLNDFLQGSTEHWRTFMGVRYVLDSTRLKGRPIQSGDLLNVHYTASFLNNGQVFDDTHLSKQPLTFRLGDPGQVIKGLEVAAHLLRFGGRGRFIIPA